MSHTKEIISSTKVKLTISVENEALQVAKQHAVAHLSKNVKVAGFRAGKAPAHLVEKQIDQSLLANEFIQEAINHSYQDAVIAEDIRPAVQPQITVTKFVPFSQVEYVAEIEVFGEIKLGDYKKLRKTRPVAKATDEEVTQTIENMRRQLAEKTEVKRASKEGDEVWIDFDGVDEAGKPVKGASGKEYPLNLGSNTFIPGFESNLIGMKAGEKKEFTLTFPKDYGVAALQNRKVTFTVTVNTVKEVKLPELNDEFVGKVSPVKTVSELKEDVAKQLEIEKQRAADNDFEAEIIKEITDKSNVELPEGLIVEQAEIVLNELKQNITYRGMTYPEYLESIGLTEEQEMEQEIKPEAIRRLKSGLVLTEIAQAEGIEVTEAEMETRVTLLKERYKSDPAMAAELDKPENRRDIEARLLTEKTILLLVEAVTRTK